MWCLTGTSYWLAAVIMWKKGCGGWSEDASASMVISTVIPQLTKIIRSGITFVSRNLR
jgi:hypothetical protein